MQVNFKIEPDDTELAGLLNKTMDLDTMRARIARQRQTARWLTECRRSHDLFCNCGSFRSHIKNPQPYRFDPPPNTADASTQTEGGLLGLKRKADPVVRANDRTHKRRYDPYDRYLNEQRKQFLSKHGPLWCKEDPWDFFDDSTDEELEWSDGPELEDDMVATDEEDGTGDGGLSIKEEPGDFADTGGYLPAVEEGTFAAAFGMHSSTRVPVPTK